jgi:hypothetical protein
MTNHTDTCRVTFYASICSALVLLSNTCHAEPPLQVPPGDELIVLDPRVDPEGKPRAVFIQTEYGQNLEIPPSVIVHRYYYSGDRDFQGPMLPGGNTLVVLKHPYSGEQMSLEVPLSPGAPRIYYRQDKIQYVYPHTTVTLHFGHFTKYGIYQEPRIKVTHGKPKAIAGREFVDETKDWIHKTGLPHAAGHVVQGAKGVVHSSAEFVHTTGERVAAPVVRVWNATPLGSLTDSDLSDAARSRRDREVQRAQTVLEQQSADFPTLR